MNLLEPNILFPLLPFFLYAETHFRIPGLYSRLFKQEPEILVDVPHRLQQQQDLPILLMVKDSDRFPVKIEKLLIRIKDKEFTFSINQELHQALWHQVFSLRLPAEWSGSLTVQAAVHLCLGKRQKIIYNDNFPGASHAPFAVEVDQNPLPGSDRCFWADLHCHSAFTNDQVEFGPPLEVLAIMAAAIGLDVVAVTDHSYDLDDRLDDYLVNDPQLNKWRSLRQSLAELNQSQPVTLIPGEEVSTGNHRGDNVHLLILNDPVFYSGHGDSGEVWFQTKPQTPAAQLIKTCSAGTAVFAAHPASQPPFPQRLFLRRGKWSNQDYALPGLHGLQIWNGEGARGFEQGIKDWIRQLLNGRRLSIIAGNDSHGDFNRVRHIKIPFWSILESAHHVFGRVRTGIFCGSSKIQDIIDALREGKSFISNGPFAQIWINQQGVGETAALTEATITISASSSDAFGFISRVELVVGDVDKKQEFPRRLSVPQACLHFRQSLPITSLPRSGYIRLQVVSVKEGLYYHCLVNPIYLGAKKV